MAVPPGPRCKQPTYDTGEFKLCKQPANVTGDIVIPALSSLVGRALPLPDGLIREMRIRDASLECANASTYYLARLYELFRIRARLIQTAT